VTPPEPTAAPEPEGETLPETDFEEPDSVSEGDLEPVSAPPEAKSPTPPRGVPAVRPAESTVVPDDISAPAHDAADDVEIEEPVKPPSDTALQRASELPPTPAHPTPPHGIPAVRPEDVAQPEPAPGLPPQTPKTDTGEMSIWEAFGMTRPSEQDAQALDDLMNELQARELKDRDWTGRTKRSMPVRLLATVLGLRLRLALGRVRVRVHRSIFTEPDR
jgi:hypothetical protein